MEPTCTSTTCYLAQSNEKATFSLITIAGLIDSLNPCAIGMMILLLGFLVVFAQKKEKVLPYGLLYIAVVYLTYLLIGLFFYQLVNLIVLQSFHRLFNRILGIGLLLAGLINIKDFWFSHLPLHLEIPRQTRPALMKLVEKTSLPATVLLAFLVTILETPCSLPIYAGTAAILAGSSLAMVKVGLYFLYYNFLFVLPLILILFLVWKGKEMVVIKEWQHRLKGKFRLLMGILLVLMGGWFLIS